MAVEKVLEKIEEQLQCSVCLETYKNPKQLLCHHICCLECLRPLVKSQQSVTCPLCRKSTPVPAGGVDSLQSAVHVAGLLEIRDSVTKIPEPVKELKSPASHGLEAEPVHSVMQDRQSLGARLMESACVAKVMCRIAVSISGMIVVSDATKHFIVVMYPSREIHSFGTRGSGLGQLNAPCGVAVDAKANILVADCNNHRIQKFTSRGQFLQVVGSKGKRRLQFKSPKGIAVNPATKKVYVVDANHRVHVLNSDLTFFKKFGKYGQGSSEFNSPQAIACDSTGKVYVADTGNHRIQVFTSRGDFILMFGRRGEGIGKLDSPYGIVVDHEYVYVGECNNNRVSLFTHDGQYKGILGEKDFPMFTSPPELDFPMFTSPPELDFPVSTSPPELDFPVSTSPPELVFPMSTSPPELVFPMSTSPPELDFPVSTSPPELDFPVSTSPPELAESGNAARDGELQAIRRPITHTRISRVLLRVLGLGLGLGLSLGLGLGVVLFKSNIMNWIKTRKYYFCISCACFTWLLLVA